MEDYRNYIAVRKAAMVGSCSQMKEYLLSKGVTAALTEAVLQKFRDFHTARLCYLDLQERTTALRYQVEKEEAKRGLQPDHASTGAQYEYNSDYIKQKRNNMEICLENVVHWLRSSNVDPVIRVRIQQDLIDIDADRLQELQLIEQLKTYESILLCRQKNLN